LARVSHRQRDHCAEYLLAFLARRLLAVMVFVVACLEGAAVGRLRLAQPFIAKNNDQPVTGIVKKPLTLPIMRASMSRTRQSN
jgi:hypothetical protein